MTQDERKGLILCLKIEFSDGLRGACAIYFGLRLQADAVIAGAPQYYIGKYLENGHQHILNGIIGEDTSLIQKLNELIPDTIVDYSGAKTRIYLHYSRNEHTYKEHIQFMIEDLHKNAYEVIEDIREYAEHSQVAMYFPRFLVESTETELRQSN